MSETTTAAAFVLARLAEDEAAACEATDVLTDGWLDGSGGLYALALRQDAARVLADVDAKRQLLDPHVPSRYTYAQGRTCDGCPAERWDGENFRGLPFAWCRMAQALAVIYADHPDYDDTWQTISARREVDHV